MIQIAAYGKELSLVFTHQSKFRGLQTYMHANQFSKCLGNKQLLIALQEDNQSHGWNIHHHQREHQG